MSVYYAFGRAFKRLSALVDVRTSSSNCSIASGICGIDILVFLRMIYMFLALSGRSKDFFCRWGAITIFGACAVISYFLAKKLISYFSFTSTSSTDSQNESFTFEIYTVVQLIIFTSFFSLFVVFDKGEAVKEIDGGGGRGIFGRLVRLGIVGGGGRFGILGSVIPISGGGGGRSS